MNKKILIGSIIAVVILVLVSFTGVVGYQTTKSSTITRASPLFHVRSSRAIDEESEDLSCDYVGKGEEINLLIPKTDFKIVLIQEVINKIRKMNDLTFNRFLNLIITLIQKNNNNKDEIVSEIILVNSQMRNQLFGGHNEDIVGNTIDRWYPFCFLEWIIDMIWFVFTIINSAQVGYSCYRCTSRITNCPEC